MDEEAKKLLQDFEKEIEPVVVEKEEEKKAEEVVVDKKDWKKLHDTLELRCQRLEDKKTYYIEIIDKQMAMIKYMGEAGMKTGLTFDQMNMLP